MNHVGPLCVDSLVVPVGIPSAQTSEGWSGGVIRRRLAQPVDGQTELTIPILQRFP